MKRPLQHSADPIVRAKVQSDIAEYRERLAKALKRPARSVAPRAFRRKTDARVQRPTQ